ncbi:MAG: hypothetical protein PHW63_09520 [Alphaproteobacteria bacterium]|nr:hypothetical protein [Alphaproteobacteria bacterium]
MVEVEQLNEAPRKYVGGECIIPNNIRPFFIDEHDVECIRFPFNHCGVMQLWRGRSGHFGAACVDTSCQQQVVMDEDVLGAILRTGDWACKYGPRGSMMLTRQEPKSFWDSLLEAHHMNRGPSPKASKAKSWADVSPEVKQRSSTANNLLRFFTRRIGL